MDTPMIIIIVLLLILVGLFLWYIVQGRRKWKEQGETLTKLVGEKVEGSMGVFGQVQQSLGQLAERTQQIQEVGKNISSLREILRSPKPRGILGELFLEELLKDSLSIGYYQLQYRFKNGEIVDAIVRIGENLVPIDSKFPLESFENMVAAEAEEDETKKIKSRRAFTQTVKGHIDVVSKYIRPDENTFDFALMYVPAENIYYETICQGGIHAYCMEKRVFLVSPNSFNAYLQAIVLGLKGLHIEKTARDILGHLVSLQDDFNDFQNDYEVLGGHIQHASQKYDDSGRKLTKLGGKLQLAGKTPVEELPESSIKKLEGD
jgi:DNA recombination protein RmuC